VRWSAHQLTQIPSLVQDNFAVLVFYVLIHRSAWNGDPREFATKEG
jgi:hypothetical protein